MRLTLPVRTVYVHQSRRKSNRIISCRYERSCGIAIVAASFCVEVSWRVLVGRPSGLGGAAIFAYQLLSLKSDCCILIHRYSIHRFSMY